LALVNLLDAIADGSQRIPIAGSNRDQAFQVFRVRGSVHPDIYFGDHRGRSALGKSGRNKKAKDREDETKKGSRETPSPAPDLKTACGA
jgi:hypothetical protein